MVQLCRNKNEEGIDTIPDSSPETWEVLGDGDEDVCISRGVFRVGTFMSMMMQGYDDQSQVPLLNG